jgi:hypothetical protein
MAFIPEDVGMFQLRGLKFTHYSGNFGNHSNHDNQINHSSDNQFNCAH